MILHVRDRIGISYHHYSRSTETALASVSDSQPMLSGMRVLHITNPFNGNDMFAVHADDRCEAGVDRSMVQLVCGWIYVRDHLKASDQTNR